MSRVILESTGLALVPDSRVDLEAGIVRGVKVLGSQSRNGRTYPPALLAQRHAAYEGAQVYEDHDFTQLRTGKARPLGSWGGVLRGATFHHDAIFADLHCLQSTQAGRIILEAAARMPEKFGLSPMHVIESKKVDGKEVVTAILEVLSVDAVTRPATTRTLFEQEGDAMADEMPPAAPMALPPPMSVEDAFVALQNAIMASDEWEDMDKPNVLKDVMKLKAKIMGDGGAEEPAADEAPAEEAHVRSISKSAKAIAELTNAVRVLTIRQMAGESLQLDAPTMQALLALPDDAAVAVQIESLRRQRRPRYSAGPPRATGRAAGSQAGPAPIPRLTAGADREAVRKHYRG